MSRLTQGDLQRFSEQGFLAVENLLDAETVIKPLQAEYMELFDGLARRSFARGKIRSLYEDLPFPQRLAQVMQESGEPYHLYMDIALTTDSAVPDMPIHTGPAVFNLLTNPGLLDAVESFIGPEIYVNPVHHVRIKPPARVLAGAYRNSLAGTTDWHQDQAVVLPEADDTEILTVWMAITDATVENGCLVVVPGSYHGSLVPHCPINANGAPIVNIARQYRRTSEAIPAPIRSGGGLFMHRQTMHASLPNVSDGIRWSFDLRFQPIGKPTGRPFFPGFVARSRRHPEAELHDWRVWAEMWDEARQRLVGKEKMPSNRWSQDAAVCA